MRRRCKLSSCWTSWRANKRKIQDILEVGISIDLHATLLSLTIDLIGYDGILLPLLLLAAAVDDVETWMELILFLTQLLSGCAGINSSSP